MIGYILNRYFSGDRLVSTFYCWFSPYMFGFTIGDIHTDVNIVCSIHDKVESIAVPLVSTESGLKRT